MLLGTVADADLEIPRPTCAPTGLGDGPIQLVAVGEAVSGVVEQQIDPRLVPQSVPCESLAADGVDPDPAYLVHGLIVQDSLALWVNPELARPGLADRQC